MHSCPVCGQACYCSGDIEDHETEASDECTHVENPECVPDDILVDAEAFDG